MTRRALVAAMFATTAAHAGPYEDGVRHLQSKSYAKAAAAFRAAAMSNGGNGAAERELGFLYYNGHGVRRNVPVAVSWFGKAAAHGDLRAQVNLGQMYENGMFIPQSDALSAKYFAMAAEQDDRKSQLRMTEGV